MLLLSNFLANLRGQRHNANPTTSTPCYIVAPLEAMGYGNVKEVFNEAFFASMVSDLQALYHTRNSTSITQKVFLTEAAARTAIILSSTNNAIFVVHPPADVSIDLTVQMIEKMILHPNLYTAAPIVNPLFEANRSHNTLSLAMSKKS